MYQELLVLYFAIVYIFVSKVKGQGPFFGFPGVGPTVGPAGGPFGEPIGRVTVPVVRSVDQLRGTLPRGTLGDLNTRRFQQAPGLGSRSLQSLGRQGVRLASGRTLPSSLSGGATRTLLPGRGPGDFSSLGLAIGPRFFGPPPGFFMPPSPPPDMFFGPNGLGPEFFTGPTGIGASQIPGLLDPRASLAQQQMIAQQQLAARRRAAAAAARGAGVRGVAGTVRTIAGQPTTQNGQQINFRLTPPLVGTASVMGTRNGATGVGARVITRVDTDAGPGRTTRVSTTRVETTPTRTGTASSVSTRSETRTGSGALAGSRSGTALVANSRTGSASAASTGVDTRTGSASGTPTLVQGVDGSFDLESLVPAGVDDIRGPPFLPPEVTASGVPRIMIPSSALLRLPAHLSDQFVRLPMRAVLRTRLPGASTNAINGVATVGLERRNNLVPGASTNAINGVAAVGLDRRNNLVPGANLRVGAVSVSDPAGTTDARTGTATRARVTSVSNGNSITASIGSDTPTSNSVLPSLPALPRVPSELTISTFGRSPLERFEAIQQGIIRPRNPGFNPMFMNPSIMPSPLLLGTNRLPVEVGGTSPVSVTGLARVSELPGELPRAPQVGVTPVVGGLPPAVIPDLSASVPVNTRTSTQTQRTDSNTIQTASLPTSVSTGSDSSSTATLPQGLPLMRGGLPILPAFPPFPSVSENALPTGTLTARDSNADTATSDTSGFQILRRFQGSLPQLPLDSVSSRGTINSVQETRATSTSGSGTANENTVSLNSILTDSNPGNNRISRMDINFPPPPPIPGSTFTRISSVNGGSATDTSTTGSLPPPPANELPPFPLALQPADLPAGNGLPSAPEFPPLPSISDFGATNRLDTSPSIQDFPPSIGSRVSADTSNSVSEATNNLGTSSSIQDFPPSFTSEVSAGTSNSVSEVSTTGNRGDSESGSSTSTSSSSVGGMPDLPAFPDFPTNG